MTDVMNKSIAVDEQIKDPPEKDSYGYSRDDNNKDYVVNGQIMVTITLSEYRALVRRNADNEVSEARSKCFTVERERDELKKQVSDLQKQLTDLRGMIASAVPINQMSAAPADVQTAESSH